MTQSPTAKSMTHGEAGLVLVFSLSAFLCLFAVAKALDTAFAFHAALASAASLWAVIAIGNRCCTPGVAAAEGNQRPAQL
jgi:cytochrome c oxidase cbb3-type subunit 1